MAEGGHQCGANPPVEHMSRICLWPLSFSMYNPETHSKMVQKLHGILINTHYRLTNLLCYILLVQPRHVTQRRKPLSSVIPSLSAEPLFPIS